MVSVGSILEGKVVSVMPFGAFVDIGNKQSGLVHISELSSRYVKDINDCVKKGDNVKVKVIKIDESGKISLSMKQAYIVGNGCRIAWVVFGDAGFYFAYKVGTHIGCFGINSSSDTCK